MAIQTGLIQLRGKLGNQVNYFRNGEYFTKSASKEYHLSEGSRKSSIEFAAASKIATVINAGLLPLRKRVGDSNFVYRLNSKVQKAVKAAPGIKGERKFTDGDISLLEDLDFNIHTKLENLLKIFPAIKIDPTELMTLTFPETEGLFPFYKKNNTTGVIDIRICSLFPDIEDSRYLQPDELEFPLGEKVFPGATLEIPLDASENKVLIIAMGVQFRSESGNFTADRKYYAGKILKTFNIKDGKVVEFIYPEPEVKENTEVIKENRISWKLHTK